jgi:hypothetical protein
MAAPTGRLVAFDGINGAALLASAQEALAGCKPALRGGISRWDASGVFEELTVADERAGTPAPRTLLLLYAADLAFRLRWEIWPAIADGRTVIAAPYVDTAVAFGRALGLPAVWLSNLFRFAPRPAERRIVEAAAARRKRDRQGFVEVVCDRWSAGAGAERRRIIDRAGAHLLAHRPARGGRRPPVRRLPAE